MKYTVWDEASEIPREVWDRPMVEVDPALRWHEHGCIKRYGVESDVMCRCEELRALRRSAEGK